MGHTKEVEHKYEVLSDKHDTLTKTHQKTVKELKIIKKKEAEFDKGIEDYLKLQSEIDSLSAERNKLQVRIDNLIATNQVQESELTVIKREIFRDKQTIDDMQIQIDKRDDQITDLKNDVYELKMELTERKRTIDRMEN